MTNEITQPKSHDETPAQMKQANEPAASDNDNDAAFKTDITHSADTEAAEEPQPAMSTIQKFDTRITNHDGKPQAAEPDRPPVLMVPEGTIPFPKTPSLRKKYPFYGLLGDLLRVAMPHTEADSTAVASQLIAATANMIGRGPYFKDDTANHYLGTNVAIVATSCLDRKTTALCVALKILRGIDPRWEEDCQVDHLWSGEDVITGVRGQTHSGSKRARSKVSNVQGTRLFIVDSEFARTLAAMRRPDDSISPVLRRLWNKGSVRTMVDEKPVKITDAHVGVVGHFNLGGGIPNLKLDAKRDGILGQFLWFFVRRSKSLFRSRWPTDELAPLVLRLKTAVAFARTVGEMKRSQKAEALWPKLRARLTEQRPQGLPGVENLKRHAPTHVMRTACMFALLDMTSTIKTQHLKAAMAMWQFVDQSIDFIFTERKR